MRTGWYESCGAAEDVIHIGKMPTPTPAAGKTLIQLYASGIAGVIAALGTDAGGFAIAADLAKAHQYAETHSGTGHVIVRTD